MSLKFVLGPSGYGKSTYVEDYIISESMANENRNYLLIVPDQFTMETQLEMVKKHPNGGILNIDVLSFGRLSYRIFSEIGESPKTLIDDTGKCLLLRRAASKHKDELSVLKGLIDRQGYIESVKATISEFMQYSIAPEDVDKMAAGAADKPHLQKKLNDINILYKGFNEELAESYITKEERLTFLARNLYKSELIKNSVVVFDGFTGFTPIQEEVIRELIRNSLDVIVTLTFKDTKDINSAENNHVCSLSVKTYDRLKKLAKDICDVEEKVITRDGENRFANEELKDLEQKIFTPGATGDSKEECKNVQVVNALNITTECRETARRIMELTKNGYRYRDIAIVTGNQDSYADVIAEIFDRYGIPYYLDRNKDVLVNPLITLIRSVFKIIINDYDYRDVVDLLRSDLTNVDLEKADKLDNYLLAKAVMGKEEYINEFVWATSEVYDEYHLREINKARNRLMKDLGLFREVKCDDKKTTAEWTSLLYDFLVQIKAEEKMQKKSDILLEKGEADKAKVYSSIYGFVCQLLDRVYDIFKEPLSAEEYYEILEAGFGEIHIGMLPQNVDVVIVGDLIRSRLSKVKALFMLGADDGNIPGASGHMSLFNDAERQLLQETKKDNDENYVLAPSKKEEADAKRMYLYMMITKPSDKLFVSYPSFDMEGKKLNPSYLINSIAGVMPSAVRQGSINEVESMSIEDEIDEMCALLALLRTGSITETEVERLREVMEDLNFHGFAPLVNEYMSFGDIVSKEQTLSEETMKFLYNYSISLSATSLSKYASCPYSFYANHMLYLRSREKDEYDSLSTGILVHAVLKDVMTYVADKGIDKIDEKVIEKIIDNSVDENANECGKSLLVRGKAGTFYRDNYRKIFKKNVGSYIRHLKKGKFKIHYLEKDYKFATPFEIDGKTYNITLNGYIDRMDILEDEKNIYVKVLDYKTGKEDFDEKKLESGEQMQLPIYFLAGSNLLMDEMAKGEIDKKEIVNAALLYQKASNIRKEEKDVKPGVSMDVINTNTIAPSGKIRDDAVVLDAIKGVDMGMDINSFEPKKGTVADPEIMDGYIKTAKDNIASFAQRMMQGDIRRFPVYKNERENACANCALYGMCDYVKKNMGQSDLIVEGGDNDGN